MTQPIFSINLEDFQQRVLDTSHTTPVLLDLWADWCSPCRVIAPLLELLIEEFTGELLIAKLEVDDGDNMKIAGQYQVRGFPTLILFQYGEEQARFSGAKPLGYMRDFIEQHAQL